MMISKIHKYISLSLLAVWLLQATTGVANVFHREIDASLLDGGSTSFDEVAFSRKIDELQSSGLRGRISSIFASGGNAAHFDVFVHTATDGLHVLRVDGQGNVLREQPWAIDFARSGVLLSMRLIHESLFLGDNARIFIGLSGIFLLTNLVLGIRLAWPVKGTWGAALKARAPARADLRLRAFHRATGLIIAVPLLITVAAGVGVAFTGPLESIIGDPAQVTGLSGLENAQSDEPWVPLGSAILAARKSYPDARLSTIRMPDKAHPYYAITLLQHGDMRRVFGKTTMYVNATSAEVLARHDVSSRPLKNRIVDAFYAVHTGEAAGLAGRIVALLCGVSLIVMITLGLSLWLNREIRRRRRRIGARAD
ncbi:MAG TPA: PepSY-associated TM helix domain-containing protein [Woeseiaceae bacterium]|nr:PepSY-associated TM helix domain-containing protein [Woeseiaceae bacterium]